jgi:zinc protease
VAAAYLKSSNRTIGEFIPATPDRAEIPRKTDVAAAVKDYKGEAVMAAGEAFDPSPAKLDARTERFSFLRDAGVACCQRKPRRIRAGRDSSAFRRRRRLRAADGSALAGADADPRHHQGWTASRFRTKSTG